MDTKSKLGSRLAQLGVLTEIDQIERTHGRHVARRRASETLVARAAVRRTSSH